MLICGVAAEEGGIVFSRRRRSWLWTLSKSASLSLLLSRSRFRPSIISGGSMLFCHLPVFMS